MLFKDLTVGQRFHLASNAAVVYTKTSALGLVVPLNNAVDASGTQCHIAFTAEVVAIPSEPAP